MDDVAIGITRKLHPACYCTTYGCGDNPDGTPVNARQLREHRYADSRNKRDEARKQLGGTAAETAEGRYTLSIMSSGHRS